MALLCNLFGAHNFTSDAEEEDEMLYVSRKQVQEYYKYYHTERDNEEKGSVNRFSLSARIAMLEELFGSKCLPDEHKECSNPSVVNYKHKHGDGTCSLDNKCCHKSQKPAGPKFNLGDIVRFKYCCTTYRIDGFKMSDGVMLYQVGEVWAEESDLEPYTEQEASTWTDECPSPRPSQSRDLSQETANCDKCHHNRLRIAAIAMAGLLANPDTDKSFSEFTAYGGRCEKEDYITDKALRYADALIKQNSN